MKIHHLGEMTAGWFVGDFEPTSLRTASCEVAAKAYRMGDCESRHVHRVATEVTLVASGRVLMNGQILEESCIAVLEPGESADFQALADTLTVVVKMPSVIGDKYPA